MQDLSSKYPERDSNPQISDPKSDAYAVRLPGHVPVFPGCPRLDIIQSSATLYVFLDRQDSPRPFGHHSVDGGITTFNAESQDIRKWSWSGSNRLHPACKAGALPDELQPQKNTLSVSQLH